MANYISFVRTNYFAVNDECKFREIISSCFAEDKITIFETDGEFGFGCYGGIYGISRDENDDCTEPDADGFHAALQGIIPEDEAIIITEIGYEKLRYFVASSIIITKTEIRSIDLRDKALEIARGMLANQSFSTQMDY